MLATEREQLKKVIQELAEKYEHKRDGMLPILQAIQERYHYVSDFAMQEVARALGVFPVEVYGVVSFYAFLYTRPKGRFIIRVCRSLSCDLAGRHEVERQLANELGIAFGETTRDGLFTLEYAGCLGMCDQSPALMVNDDMHARVEPGMVADIIESYRRTVGFTHLQSSRPSVGEPTAPRAGRETRFGRAGVAGHGVHNE